MNLSFLKFGKKHLPPLKSLRPAIFDVDRFWFRSLSVGVLVFIITGFIGFNFLYSQYFETYKKSKQPEDYDNIINIERLKNAINKRNSFINQETVLPRDPSE